ncbi:MAG: hypothetical protein R6X35_14635 [Candidatus Krumholzibacteriia bacterium]
MKRTIRAAFLAVLVAVAGTLPASAQWIGFDPAETVPATEVFTVALVLDTEGVTVMGADVLFTFDPAVVRLDSVTVGDWFTTAPQPYFFWADAGGSVADLVQVTGSVMTTGRAGAGALAVLHFTALAAGFCDLEFRAVSLRDPLNASVPHTRSTGDRIIIEEAIGVGTASFGGLKARWR